MTRRLLMALLVLTLLVSGCARRQWNTSERLETLRELEAYNLTHAVAPGETLRSIADLYYDDPSRADEIALVNGLADPDLPEVGERLELLFTAEEWSEAEGRRSALAAYKHGVAAVRAGRREAYLRATRAHLLPLTLASNTGLYHALNLARADQGCPE